MLPCQDPVGLCHEPPVCPTCGWIISALTTGQVAKEPIEQRTGKPCQWHGMPVGAATRTCDLTLPARGQRPPQLPNCLHTTPATRTLLSVGSPHLAVWPTETRKAPGPVWPRELRGHARLCTRRGRRAPLRAACGAQRDSDPGEGPLSGRSAAHGAAPRKLGRVCRKRGARMCCAQCAALVEYCVPTPGAAVAAAAVPMDDAPGTVGPGRSPAMALQRACIVNVRNRYSGLVRFVSKVFETLSRTPAFI